MRIGIGGLSCECSTFSPLATREEDFHISGGKSLLKQYGFLADHPGFEFIPLVRARALPGGRIKRRFYDDFLSDLLCRIRDQGPFDGLLLPMHGASSVFGMEDAEGHFIAAIREAAGQDCVIAASYDLHGNLSAKVAAHLDVLTAYRTAPHEDWYETVERAFRLLVICLRSRERPAKSHITPPVLLPGEQTGTDWEPAANLYGLIPTAIEKYGLLDASILMGYVWADEPRASASVFTLGPDPNNVREAAEFLAGRLWDARREFRFEGFAGSLDKCLDQARAESGRPVLISDSGDNPTAGGAGDIPFALKRLLDLRVEDALVAGITDPGAMAHCRRVGRGAGVALELGGKLDPLNGQPLRVAGKVISINDTVLQIGDGGERPNQVAVVEIRGITVIITERRTPFHRLEQFLELGLTPEAFKIIVVKIGYLVPELRQIAAASLLALTPGAVNQDISGLSYRRLERPMFPFDPDMEWSPSK